MSQAIFLKGQEFGEELQLNRLLDVLQRGFQWGESTCCKEGCRNRMQLRKRGGHELFMKKC